MRGHLKPWKSYKWKDVGSVKRSAKSMKRSLCTNGWNLFNQPKLGTTSKKIFDVDHISGCKAGDRIKNGVVTIRKRSISRKIRRSNRNPSMSLRCLKFESYFLEKGNVFCNTFIPYATRNLAE